MLHYSTSLILLTNNENTQTHTGILTEKNKLYLKKLEKHVKEALNIYGRNHTLESYCAFRGVKLELDQLSASSIEYSLKCIEQFYWEQGEKPGKLLASCLKHPKQKNNIYNKRFHRNNS